MAEIRRLYRSEMLSQAAIARRLKATDDLNDRRHPVGWPTMSWRNSCSSTLYYIRLVFETADWSHRGDYIAKHGITADEADEALADPDRLVINPDPA